MGEILARPLEMLKKNTRVKKIVFLQICGIGTLVNGFKHNGGRNDYPGHPKLRGRPTEQAQGRGVEAETAPPVQERCGHESGESRRRADEEDQLDGVQNARLARQAEAAHRRAGPARHAEHC